MLGELYAVVKEGNQQAKIGASKFRQILNDIIERLRKLFNSLTGKQKAEVKADIDELTRLRDIFESAMVAGVKKNAEIARKQTQKSTSEEVRYSIREGLRDDLKTIYKSRTQNGRNELVIGTTSDFLVNTLKADPLKVTMPMGKAYAAMATEEDAKHAGRYNRRLNYHGLGAELLYESLVASENPVVAFVSENEYNEKTGKAIDRSDRLVLVTDKVKDGNNIVVVTEMETPGTVDGGQETVNKDVTVYDRNTLLSDISKAIADNRLLHYDKKRSHTITAGKPASNSLGTIQKVDFEANISQFWGNVKFKRAKTKIKLEAEPKDNETPFAKALREAEIKSDGKFSIKDSTGKTLTEGQQEYFKDSKVRDENGNLRVMYRGENEDFTVFDRKKSKYSNLYGRGFYFTDSESHASQYGNIKAYYLDIKNPVPTTETTIAKAQMRKFLEAVSENGDDYSFENYGYGATVESVLNSVYSGKSDFKMLYDVSQTAVGDMVETVELFNEVNGTDFDGLILDTETVTFRSEQAKLTDNTNPTRNPDIRFSLKQPVEETKDLVAMHNMSEQQLLDVLTRGQFIMPSVAVTNKGLEAFGDISVLFNKDTIDPNQNENNKLYGSDAWTPTQTELKKNPKFDDKATANALRGIRKTLGDFAPQIFKDNSALFKQNIAKADGSVYNAYAHNVGMQAAYAMESGLISAIPKDANGNVNTKKLQSQLDAVLDKDSEWRKYERWLSDISNKIITSYDKASNEDILRDMKSQPDYAKKFRLSMDGELTAPVVEYSSVEEFRSNKARLSETAEQDAASLGKEFLQWAKTIPGAKMRDVVNAINSTFDSRYSGKDIVKAFADKGITISAKRADSLQSLYKKAVELSTPYFEAKPQRGVGVNEIAAVVLPSNARAELVSKLRETGINILTYNKGNSADRVNKVNSVENVKFSLRDSTAQKNTDQTDGEEYGLKNLHITEDMSDGERTNILSKKSVVAPIYEGQSDEAIENNSAKLNSAKIGLVKDAIVAISEQFGVLERDISIEDVGVEIRLSKSNLKESVSKKISPSIIAKLIPVLTESVSNAIGVERHSNRYFYDSNTVYFENLLGGYVDGDCFIPVRFGLKHSTTGKATLYVVVDQNKILLESLDKIKTTEVVNVAGSQKAPQNTSRSVEYKISQIIPFVKSKDLLRYIPDNMLNEEQKTAKWEGIAEVVKKTADKNDKKYTEYIKSGNLRAASEMVGRAAKAAGYTIKAYHGTSKGGFTWFDTYAYFSRFGLFGNGAYFTENRDIAEQYTKKGRGNNPQVYSVFLSITNPIDMDAKADIDAWNKAFQKSGEDFSLLEGEKTNEQAFRSMVEDLEYMEVYSYDAAEIVRNIFEDMGYNGITHMGGGRVNADGIRHRVWIAFNPEQAKSADTITYDDEGNIIPISERFNSDKYDIRYSLKGVNVSGASLQTIAEVRKAAAEGDVDTLSKYVERGLISTESYNQLIEEYGAIPKGEKPYRDIEVPQKTEKDKKVSQTVRTILEAKATPDEAVPTIQKMVEDGVFSYDAYTDKEAIAKTEEKLREHGWKDSYKNWMNAVNKGEVSKDITAMGWALYNNAANTAASTTSETERRDAIQTSLEVLDAMVRHQRSAASTTTQQWQISRLKKAGRFSKQSRWNGQEKNNKGTEKSVPLFSFKSLVPIDIDNRLDEIARFLVHNLKRIFNLFKAFKLIVEKL